VGVEPAGARRFRVARESSADGRTIAEITDLPGDVWVSFAIRDQQLLPVTGDTRLQAGDEVLVLADPDVHGQLSKTFEHSA
jgi:cell volume regulation protein A